MQNLTRLCDDEDDEMWLRRLTLSEEHIRRRYPGLRGGYYRWFESPNVVDLVRIRRLRSKQRELERNYDTNDD